MSLREDNHAAIEAVSGILSAGLLPRLKGISRIHLTPSTAYLAAALSGYDLLGELCLGIGSARCS